MLYQSQTAILDGRGRLIIIFLAEVIMKIEQLAKVTNYNGISDRKKKGCARD